MAQGFFRMTCLLLALTVQRGVQDTASTTQTDQSLNKSVLGKLKKIENALSKGQSSCGGGFGPIIAQLVAEQSKMQNQIAAGSSATSSMKAELQLKLQKTKEELQLKLQKIEEELHVVKDMGLKMDQGSTFVRWGRKKCPANTALVYSGVAGGKRYDEKGSGTNTLCLTRYPQLDNTSLPSHYGLLYGAEYELITGHHDHDIPCSLCRAPQSTTIMIASTRTCPPGWTAQYTGHLISQWKNYYATDYVCLDGNPENDRSGDQKNDDGHVVYYVATVCGALPCPPYENGKIVTCVVCSK